MTIEEDIALNRKLIEQLVEKTGLKLWEGIDTCDVVTAQEFADKEKKSDKSFIRSLDAIREMTKELSPVDQYINSLAFRDSLTDTFNLKKRLKSGEATKEEVQAFIDWRKKV